MLAYNLKTVLEIIPEAMPFVKQAAIDLDYPTNNADSVLASALVANYTKLQGNPGNAFDLEKIAKAVSLYGLQDRTEELCSKMQERLNHKTLLEKKAEQQKQNFELRVSYFEGERSSKNDPEYLSKQAELLYEEAKQLDVAPPESIERYSAHQELSKEAAVQSLAARYQATKDVTFAKIASALSKLDTQALHHETVKDICKTVTSMDKAAGLHVLGFDFYKEALLDKQAAVSVMQVKLCNKPMPYEKIARLGRDRISQYIGEDVAKEMDKSAGHAKIAFESMPRDLQQLLVQLVNNV